MGPRGKRPWSKFLTGGKWPPGKEGNLIDRVKCPSGPQVGSWKSDGVRQSRVPEFFELLVGKRKHQGTSAESHSTNVMIYDKQGTTWQVRNRNTMQAALSEEFYLMEEERRNGKEGGEEREWGAHLVGIGRKREGEDECSF